MSCDVRKLVFEVPTRSNINRPVHLQKMARNLKFRILGGEELYYPCSENKYADQLLHLCSPKGKSPVFL